MSLLGVVSRWPVFARAAPSDHAWGFVVQEPSRRWTVSAEGSGGVLAVSRGPQDWTLRASELPPALAATSTITGELIVAAAVPGGGRIERARSSSWYFIYEGAIIDIDALCAALEPACFVRGGYPRSAGNLLFAHIVAHLADASSNGAMDRAFVAVARDLQRARSLGPAAFLCSNGARLYGYAAGQRLVFSNVAGAILVGSPEVLPPRTTSRELSDGSLVVLAKLPELGWSTLTEA